MNYLDMTKRYYAEWLDCDFCDFSLNVKYICTTKRDRKPLYYPSPYLLFVCQTEQSTIVSFSKKIQKYIDIIKMDDLILNHESQLAFYLEKLFEGKIIHNIKFVFDQAIESPTDNVYSLYARSSPGNWDQHIAWISKKRIWQRGCRKLSQENSG